MKPLTPEAIGKFWSKVDKGGPNGCWLWRGRIDTSGYAAFGHGTSGHRLAWTLLNGPIAPGLTVDHLCRVRECVNPAHMELVSHRTNTLRGDTITAANAQKTHCIRGHEFTPENTFVRQSYTTKARNGTQRVCRTCKRERERKHV